MLHHNPTQQAVTARWQQHDAADCDLRPCRGRAIALDVVRGLLHMHTRRLVHLDLKVSPLQLPARGLLGPKAAMMPLCCPCYDLLAECACAV